MSGSGISWAASAEPYASLHLAPDRWPCQHPTTHVFSGRMPFLPSNQQRQNTEGTDNNNNNNDRLTAFDPGQPG